MSLGAGRRGSHAYAFAVEVRAPPWQQRIKIVVVAIAASSCVGCAQGGAARALHRFIVCVGYNECVRGGDIYLLYRRRIKMCGNRLGGTMRPARSRACVSPRRADHTRRSPGTTQHAVHVNSRIHILPRWPACARNRFSVLLTPPPPPPPSVRGRPYALRRRPRRCVWRARAHTHTHTHTTRRPTKHNNDLKYYLFPPPLFRRDDLDVSSSSEELATPYPIADAGNV